MLRFAQRFLLNVIIGLAGAELGHIGGLVLLLVQAGHGGVQGGAGDQVLLPGDLLFTELFTVL